MEVSKLPPADPPASRAGTAALIQVETTVQSSLERAVSVVAAWRDTSPLVVDAAKETRVLFIEALGDEAQNLSWLRLTDPDYPLVSLDENEEFRR